MTGLGSAEFLLAPFALLSGAASTSSPSLGGAQSPEDAGCQHVLTEGSKEEPCRQLGVTEHPQSATNAPPSGRTDVTKCSSANSLSGQPAEGFRKRPCNPRGRLVGFSAKRANLRVRETAIRHHSAAIARLP